MTVSAWTITVPKTKNNTGKRNRFISLCPPTTQTNEMDVFGDYPSIFNAKHADICAKHAEIAMNTFSAISQHFQHFQRFQRDFSVFSVKKQQLGCYCPFQKTVVWWQCRNAAKYAVCHFPCLFLVPFMPETQSTQIID